MIYFIYNGKHIKIGYSKNPKKRIKQLQTASSLQLKLLGYIEGNKKIEKELHMKFANYNIKNEWFKINDKLVNFINQNNMMLINNMIAHIDWDYKGEILMVYGSILK